jgi:hypothetical protein
MCDAPITLTCTPGLERDFSLVDINSIMIDVLNESHKIGAVKSAEVRIDGMLLDNMYTRQFSSKDRDCESFPSTLGSEDYQQNGNVHR